ncbi:unnamed protein product [Angiostrongylus costaricensis]|uniref:Penicillin-binding protein n=1 Tax=Angiostrongylus costaricensis TaxID=334426 RepID=A0A0R3PUV4_ANGCS|nr:unnamed protein product [Angiostrongylus costaricensis]
MVASNNVSQAASPRSESYGPGVLQMVVDNVLSGSPASVKTRLIAPYLMKGDNVIGGPSAMQSSAPSYGYEPWNVPYATNPPLSVPSNIENSQNG